MFENKLKIYILFVTFCVSLLGFSQESFYKRYTVNDGLLSSDNYMTFQDQDGFMWICSNKGLVKFDGVNFKTFTVQEGLPINDIWYINQDSQKRIWLGGFFKGLYYIQNDSVIKVNTGNEINSLLYCSENDQGDTLYFASTYKKGYFLTGDELKINASSKDFSIVKPNIRNLTIQIPDNPKGNIKSLLLLYRKDSTKLKKSTMRWSEIITKLNKQFVTGNQLLIVNQEEIRAINPIEYFGGEIEKIQTVTPTKEVMVNINDSLRVYTDLFTKERNHWLEQKIEPFIDKNISWITLDNENNLWLTLYRGNIIFIPNNNHLIKHYQPELKSEKSVVQVKKTNDLIYLTSFDGSLYEFDEKKEEINRLKNRELQDWASLIRHIGIYKNELFLVQSNSISTSKNGKFSEYLMEKKSTPINPSKVNFIDDNHFISCNFNRYKLLANGEYILLDKKNKVESRTQALISNKKYHISGGIEGVYFLNRENNVITHHIANDVQCLHFIKDKLLVGTNGEGILLMDFDGNILSSFHQGLSIMDIEVQDDTLFIATNKGILIDKYISGSLLPIKNITFADGLSSNDVYDIEIGDSLIYTGTVNGFNTIDYRSIIKQSIIIPTIFLDNVKVNHHNEIKNNDKLHWDENTLTFNYTGISFSSLGDITYKYRLLGLSEKWETTRKKSITYWSLAAGKYSFEVKVISSNGVESPKATSQIVTIKKHFSETLGFKIIIILGLLGLLTITLSYYQRKKRKKLEVEKRFAEIEMKALQSQMNPHFIFNALNALQSVMFLKGEKETNKFIGAFSKLMRVTLDNSKKSNIALTKEIEYLELYIGLEKRRLNNELNYKLTVDPSLELNLIEIPSMLFQPLVENAIIHGLIPKKGNRQLIIKFHQDQNHLIGEVTDNGVGREQALLNNKGKDYKSWGSSILQEKIAVINRLNQKKVTFEIFDLKKEGKPVGTKTIIKLPLKNEN